MLDITTIADIEIQWDMILDQLSDITFRLQSLQQWSYSPVRKYTVWSLCTGYSRMFSVPTEGCQGGRSR